MIGERRGHPVVAAFIVLLSGMFGLAGWEVVSLIVNLSDYPETDYNWGDPPVIVGLVMTGAVVLGGLWWAWREGTGYWGLRPLTALPHTWRVADESPVAVLLIGTAPESAAEFVESTLRERPNAPVTLDLAGVPPGYEKAIGRLLNLLAHLGEPRVTKKVLILNPAPEVKDAAIVFARRRGWDWEGGATSVTVEVRTPPA